MNTKSNEILDKFNELFQNTPEEQDELDAQLLAYSFMSIIEEAMEQKGINRAELAQKVGTSKSFITQLFRGDRTPNWKFLAKAAKTLELEFVISTRDEISKIESDALCKAMFKKLPLSRQTTNEIFAA